jgi:hypothetical protein
VTVDAQNSLKLGLCRPCRSLVLAGGEQGQTDRTASDGKSKAVPLHAMVALGGRGL